MPEMGTTEATPDLDELLQEEAVVQAVPVRGEGVFLAQLLPSRRVQYGTDSVPDTVWTDLLPATPKRARAVLVSDVAFMVNNVSTGSGMLVPAGTALEIRHTDRVYVRSAGPTPSVAVIGHTSELWAD